MYPAKGITRPNYIWPWPSALGHSFVFPSILSELLYCNFSHIKILMLKFTDFKSRTTRFTMKLEMDLLLFFKTLQIIVFVQIINVYIGLRSLENILAKRKTPHENNCTSAFFVYIFCIFLKGQNIVLTWKLLSSAYMLKIHNPVCRPLEILMGSIRSIGNWRIFLEFRNPVIFNFDFKKFIKIRWQSI